MRKFLVTYLAVIFTLGVVTFAQNSIGETRGSARKMGMSKADDVSNFAKATVDLPKTRVDKIVDAAQRIKPSNVVQDIDPDVIKFSQRSVNDAAEITDSMRRSGWQGEAIDIVKQSDGTLVTMDNTRVLAASRAGIKAKARVRGADELLTPQQAERFKTARDGTPRTWEEAARFRINKQGAKFRDQYPRGSYITGSSD